MVLLYFKIELSFLSFDLAIMYDIFLSYLIIIVSCKVSINVAVGQCVALYPPINREVSLRHNSRHHENITHINLQKLLVVSELGRPASIKRA